jgi:hypothetical protein
MSELRAQVVEAVKARRMPKAKTRTNQKYLKMSRKQLENFLTEKASKLGQTQQGTLQETQRTKGAPENGTYINRKLIDLDRS